MAKHNRNSARELLRKALAKGGFTLKRVETGPELPAIAARFWPRETEHALVRVGGEGDGGYLLPDDLEGLDRCFSPGVSDIANFELELAQRGVPSHLADASVAGSPVKHELIQFSPVFLGALDMGNVRSLDSWVAEHARPGENELLLQMDIEGSEVETIMAASRDTLKRFRIIVLELHGLENLATRLGWQAFKVVLDKLEQEFVLVHAHPNNNAPVHPLGDVTVPGLIELTYLRRDRIADLRGPARVPHPLDRRCVPEKPELTLAEALTFPRAGA